MEPFYNLNEARNQRIADYFGEGEEAMETSYGVLQGPCRHEVLANQKMPTLVLGLISFHSKHQGS